MVDKIKNIVRGAGSILEIWPHKNHRDFYTRFNANETEALRKNWERVGQYLWKAIDQVDTDARRETPRK